MELMIRLLTVVATAGLAGCGLISSDVTDFDLALPDKTFTVDTRSWDVSQDEADALLSTPCAGNEGICAAVAQQACESNCVGSCSATTQTCELALDVSVYQVIDLIAEQPELKSIDDEPVIEVGIDSVTWEVTANTLNVPTPELTVFVAPATVMDPKDPEAIAIGTIDSVDAGVVTDAPQPLVFTANGKAQLIAAMRTFKTPFNIMVGATLELAAGQDVPDGMLVAVVHIKGRAGL
jgi:hypothetical protein